MDTVGSGISADEMEFTRPQTIRDTVTGHPNTGGENSNVWEKIETAMDAVTGVVDFSRSVMNGIVGDTLHIRQNGLAVQMDFMTRKAPLLLKPEAIKKHYPILTPKVCILVHGLACNEKVWRFGRSEGADYGRRLQQDFGYTPFYLRYNTGLHISENGGQLAEKIERLHEIYPAGIDEMIIVGHSMGGLVAKSAWHYGIQHGHAWLKNLRKVFYLGSPHRGAPLEKFGNIVAWILRSIPTKYTMLISKIINLRSSGIKDLRFGYILDEDWMGTDPDDLLRNNRKDVPLPKEVHHYLASGSLTRDPNHFISQCLGDLLVRKASAAVCPHVRTEDSFPPRLVHREFPGVGHMNLAHSRIVYDQIREWMGE